MIQKGVDADGKCILCFQSHRFLHHLESTLLQVVESLHLVDSMPSEDMLQLYTSDDVNTNFVYLDVATAPLLKDLSYEIAKKGRSSFLGGGS